MLAFVFCGLNAQSISGAWNGKLNLGNSSLALVFNIQDSLAKVVTMDSPDQHAFGMVSDSSYFCNDSLFVAIRSIGMSVKGYFDVEKDSIFATFKQMSFACDLVLGRGAGLKEKVARKQDPTDFPYYIEEVSIKSSADVVLAGTLTMPNELTDCKPTNKIVILISGSGPQNRNEELMDHRPFLVLSDFLTRKGIAVIRYDDRGVEKSTGDFASATSYEHSLDAEAVVNYIKQRNDLKGMSIGLIGHSEGGMIAPMLASRNADVDFIVLMASPGIPITELMTHQNIDAMIAGSAPESIIKLETKSLKQTYSILTNKKLSDEAKYNKVLSIATETYNKYPAGFIQKESIKQIAETKAKAYFSPWFKYFINFNPQEYLQKVSVPVLAINGTNDIQVRAKENLAGIEKSLKKGGNNNVSIVSLPQLNHLFQKCLFGNIEMYAKNEETFNEEAMGVVADWIRNR